MAIIATTVSEQLALYFNHSGGRPEDEEMVPENPHIVTTGNKSSAAPDPPLKDACQSIQLYIMTRESE